MYPDAKRTEALKLYEEGWRCRAISLRVGVPLPTIYSWTKERAKDKKALARTALEAVNRLIALENPCKNREAFIKALPIIRDTLVHLTKRPGV